MPSSSSFFTSSRARILSAALVMAAVATTVFVLGSGAPLRASIIPDGSTLTATPATVSTCNGQGSTSLAWTTTSYALYELHQGSESGPVVATSSGSGQHAVSGLSASTTYALVKVERKYVGGKWQLVRSAVAQTTVGVVGCPSPSPSPSQRPTPSPSPQVSSSPTPGVSGGTNVALASNGARATASSTYGDGRFTVASIIDGNRGTAWATAAHPGWSDATNNQYPDWVQVDFAGTKRIDRINVFTLQDPERLGQPITESESFTRWGIQDFTVQYRTGGTWVTIPNGSVTGNNRVWRRFDFAPIQTDALRITITRSLGEPWYYSRIQEVEAWQTAPSLSWDPGIRRECYAEYVRSAQGAWGPGARQGPDCSGHPGSWLFGVTNENAQFEGGSINDIPFSANDGLLKWAFHDQSDGSHQLGWVIDKVNHGAQWLNKYTFFGFTENYDFNNTIPRPSVGDNVSVRFRAKLMAAEGHDIGGEVGEAKNRMLLGAVARWGGRSHFVEVNLWRTPNFDLENDSQNLIDRRFGWNMPNWNRGVYYYGPRLGLLECPACTDLPTFTADGQWHDIKIPLMALFRSTNWDDAPSDWSQVEIAGLYIGHEVWGKGRVWAEFDDYDLVKE